MRPRHRGSSSPCLAAYAGSISSRRFGASASTRRPRFVNRIDRRSAMDRPGRLRAICACALLLLGAGATRAFAQAATPGGAKPVAADEARDRNLRAYVDLLRSDIRAQKSAIISEMMQLNDADEAKFWPIYLGY